MMSKRRALALAALALDDKAQEFTPDNCLLEWRQAEKIVLEMLKKEREKNDENNQGTA